jgi:hypothetical protein
MSRRRARGGMAVGVAGFLFLVLLLPLVNPGPVHANRGPIDLPLVRDPGTPFEEPEVITPSSSGGGAMPARVTPVGPAVLMKSAPAAAPTVTPSDTARLLRRILVQRLLSAFWKF